MRYYKHISPVIQVTAEKHFFDIRKFSISPALKLIMERENIHSFSMVSFFWYGVNFVLQVRALYSTKKVREGGLVVSMWFFYPVNDYQIQSEEPPWFLIFLYLSLYIVPNYRKTKPLVELVLFSRIALIYCNIYFSTLQFRTGDQ